MKQLGPYEILAELGRGGMGAVYRARHTELGGEVALKIVLPEIADPVVIARFKREAQAAAKLAGHPGIVGVRDLGEIDGTVFLAMDLVQGADLGETVDRGDHAPDQLAAMVRDAARAVHHAHTHGILHRDLKPDNIMIAADGTARVTDFGLAKPTALDASATRLTKSEMVLGTPSYMPPEQAQGGAVDARTDVYSLGATLYDCLAGVPPFEGSSVYEVLANVLRAEAKPLRKRDPRIPRELDTIVMKCLEKRPADRYATAADLADDLDRFLAGDPILARRISAGGRAARFLGRHRARVAIAGAVFAAAAGFTWWGMEGAEREASEALTLRDRSTQTKAADLSTQLSEAYLALDRDTWHGMQLLEAHYYGAVDADVDLDAVHAEIQDAADRIAATHPDIGLPAAWRALALFYLREPAAEDAFRRARKVRVADPFPALLHGFTKLVAYQDGTDVGQFAVSQGEARADGYIESPAQAALRTDATTAFDEAAVRGSEGLAHGREFAQLAKGAASIARADYEAAQRELAPLRDDPRFAVASLGLIGLAAFLRNDMATAGDTWAGAARGRCDELTCRAAMAWLGDAAHNLADPDATKGIATKAIALLQPLLERRPDHPDARKLRGLLRLQFSAAQEAQGDDPRPVLRDAGTDFSTALETAPDSYVLVYNFGEVKRRSGDAARRRGHDPDPSYRAALALFERAQALDPERVDTYSALGSTYRSMALHTGPGRHETVAHLRRAVQYHSEVVTRKPDSVSARMNRAIARYELGRHGGDLGVDPTEFFHGAVEDCDVAESQNPDLPNVYLVRANARSLWAAYLDKTGGDSAARWAAVGTDLDLAVAKGPKDATMWGGRALYRLRRAMALARTRTDPRPMFRSAMDDFDQALALNPASPQQWFNYAAGCYQLAVTERRYGGDVHGAFERAERAFTGGLERKPDHWLAYAHRGRVRMALSKFAEAVTDFEECLRRRQGAPGVAKLLADARARLAQGR